MNIGLDFDDTLVNTAKVVNKYAKKFDKENLKGKGKLKKINDSKDYYYFAECLNWNHDNIKDFFDMYYLDIIKNVKLKKFVKHTLKKMKERGDKIYIITSRRKRENDIVEKMTRKTLEKYNIKVDDIIINAKSKSQIANDLNIDIFVDDSYLNCLDVYNNTNAKVYMLQTQFNKGIIDNNILKIKSIKELLGD